MTSKDLHIVLAEDDKDDRLFFTNAFKSLKIENELTICENGFQLMDFLKNAQVLPHILFLDMNMPGKDGMECLKELRGDSRYTDLTIAIYTSLNSPTINMETLTAGANIFIRKPSDPEVLKKILLEVVYINWQYITDGLSKENFMLSY